MASHSLSSKPIIKLLESNRHVNQWNRAENPEPASTAVDLFDTKLQRSTGQGQHLQYEMVLDLHMHKNKN